MTDNENTEEKKINLDDTTDLKYLAEYLKDVPENTKIYIGCDSERLRKNGVWHADYCVVVVIHKGGNNGCKLFGEITRERDYDQKFDKPSFRLMNEVYKVVQFYLDNFDLLDQYNPEIHLDINPDEKHGSSCVITQAVGYVRGVCGITPKVKPDAFCASFAADKFAYVRANVSKKAGRKAKKIVERKEKLVRKRKQKRLNSNARKKSVSNRG